MEFDQDDLSDGTLSDVMQVLASSSEDEGEQTQPDMSNISFSSDSSDNTAELGSNNHEHDFDLSISVTDAYDHAQSVPLSPIHPAQNIRRKRRHHWHSRKMLEEAAVALPLDFKAMYRMFPPMFEKFFDLVGHLFPYGNITIFVSYNCFSVLTTFHILI